MRYLATFLCLLAVHAAQLLATPITSLDQEESQLATHLQTPETLVLTVRSPSDLPEAQRLLTLAASRELPSLVLVVLPDSLPEAIAIRRAARRFFTSDFSRPRTHFIKSEDHPYPEFKTLLLSPIEPAPLFASQTFPTELP